MSWFTPLIEIGKDMAEVIQTMQAASATAEEIRYVINNKLKSANVAPNDQQELHRMANQFLTQFTDQSDYQPGQVHPRQPDTNIITPDNRRQKTSHNIAIPEFRPEGGRAIHRIPQLPSSQSNSLTTTNMEVPMIDTLTTRGVNPSTSLTGTQNNSLPKQIQPTRPYRNEVAAILSSKFYISINNLQTQAADNNYFKIKMNTPYLPLANMPAMVTQEAFVRPANGLYTTKSGSYITQQSQTTQLFINLHSVLSNNTFPSNVVWATHQPTMHTYYAKLYDAYTVTKTDWKITITFPYQSFVNSYQPTPDGTEIGVCEVTSYTHPGYTTTGTVFTVPQHTIPSLSFTNPISVDYPGGEAGAKIFWHYEASGDSFSGYDMPKSAFLLAI